MIPHGDREETRNNFNGEIAAKKHERDAFSKQVAECTGLLDETRTLLEKKGKYDDDQASLKEKREDLSEYMTKSSEKKKRIIDLKAEIEENKTRLEATKVE